MAGASHEKSFGHVDLEILVRNLSDTVLALKPLKWFGPEAYLWELLGCRQWAGAKRENKTTQARRV